MRQLELTERLLRLRGVPVFRSMSTGDLARLAEAIVPRTFQRGQIVLREDEPPRSFFVLGTGTVTMRRKGKPIGTVRAPGAVGFMSALARTAGSTEAIADSYVESFEMPIDAIDEVFEDHFPVMLGMLRWVCERIIEENRGSAAPPFTPPEVPFDQLVGDRELGIVERIFLLRSSQAFKHANVNSIARLARAMQEVRVPAGEKIWEVGAPSSASYFIVKGMMRLIADHGDRVQIVGPGYVIGGAEALVGAPRWNEFIADEPAVLLRGSREGLIDMFEDDHEIAIRFLSMLATFLVTTWDRKAEAGVLSVGSPEQTPPVDDDELTTLPA